MDELLKMDSPVVFKAEELDEEECDYSDVQLISTEILNFWINLNEPPKIKYISVTASGQENEERLESYEYGLLPEGPIAQ